MLPTVHFKMKQISMRKTSLIQKYKQIIYSTGFPMKEVTFCLRNLYTGDGGLQNLQMNERHEKQSVRELEFAGSREHGYTHWVNVQCHKCRLASVLCSGHQLLKPKRSSAGTKALSTRPDSDPPEHCELCVCDGIPELITRRII